MGHGHNNAKPVKDEWQRLGNDAQGLQQGVDDALFLQHHNPGGGANQQRGPKGQQNQYQQQVGGLVAQVRQPIGQWEAQQNTHQRDAQGHTQCAQVNRDVDTPVFALARNRAILLALEVRGSQKKQLVLARFKVADRAPDAGLGPSGVSGLEKWCPGPCLLFANAAGCAHKYSAQANFLDIQAVGNRARFFCLNCLFQVVGQGRKHRLWWHLAAVAAPVSQRAEGARQTFGNHGIMQAVE